jgi:hypothetical protein
MLTKRGADVLARIERQLDDANRALGPLPNSASNDTTQLAAAPDKDGALAEALEGKAFGPN